MTEALILPYTVLEDIINHARTEFPGRATGRLIGVGARVHFVIPLEAEDWLKTQTNRSDKLELLGFYGSQPDTAAHFNPSDFPAEIEEELTYAVYSIAKSQFRVYKVSPEKMARLVPLIIEEETYLGGAGI